MKFLDKYEKRYSKLLLQKIKDIDVVKEKTVEEFINNFLNVYNKHHNTIYVNSKVQTGYKHSCRSLQDMYALVRFYYPDTSFYDFIKSIKNLTHSRKIMGLHFCSTINRYVFTGKLGVTVNDYLSNQSNDKLFNLLNEIE